MLRIKDAPISSWMSQSSHWMPNEIEDEFSEYVPHRRSGRPYLKWDCAVNKFCYMHHNDCWQNLSIDVLNSSMDRFVQFFCSKRDEFIPLASDIIRPVCRTIDARSHNVVPFFQLSTDTWW